MKKWIWLCIVLPTLLLAACSEKSEPPPRTPLSDTGQVMPDSIQALELPPSDSVATLSTEAIAASEESGKFYDVESAVSEAILNENRERYLAGECMGEGHRILGTEEEEGQVKVYLLAMFGWYQFQDGNFVKNSGSGAIPTVITFRQETDGAYSLIDYKTAQDGSLFVPSIKELFPETCWEACISPSDNDRNALEKQEREYAAAYLKEIGRKAEIGDYSDFEHTLLTDVGVSVEVSNRLLEKKDDLLSKCPIWIGNVELVENGIRYRYEMAYAPDQKEISYSKTDLRTSKIVEETVFDSESGDLVRHKNAADKNTVPLERELNSLTGVSMEVVEGSPTAVSVKLRLKNETDMDIIYGESYEIENYSDGQWRSVPYIIENWAFNEVANKLKKNEQREITLNWQVFHGKLDPGRYRIIKDVDDFSGTGDHTKYYIGAEFEINNNLLHSTASD